MPQQAFDKPCGSHETKRREEKAMTKIAVDFTKTQGKIKPMNAVNNGPTSPGIRKDYTSFDAYKALNIPYARNHDASFFNGYGTAGEHVVDVHRIFKNFDADENDPASYFFEPTDHYIKTTLDAGTETFYRLGASIEHGYKYGTRVPPDFAKWARICEHIIRHYNEGWANGFEYGIKYWEIWNEPECGDSPTNHPCWQGTLDEFLELYCVTAKHLKSCFPQLKIGGPAFTSPWVDGDWDSDRFRIKFLDTMANENIPFDFYSFHLYAKVLSRFEEAITVAREELDKRGLTNVETILNEWNYIRGWNGDNWRYSLDAERGLKGSSFIAGAMSIGQALPLDMLMYYDARPCRMNGLFAHETYEPLKGYYAFVMFDKLAKLGDYARCEYKADDLYCCAATDGKSGALMLTYYSEDDSSLPVCAELSLNTNYARSKVEIYLTDEENNMALVSESTYDSDSVTLSYEMKLHSTIFIKVTEG